MPVAKNAPQLARELSIGKRRLDYLSTWVELCKRTGIVVSELSGYTKTGWVY